MNWGGTKGDSEPLFSGADADAAPSLDASAFQERKDEKPVQKRKSGGRNYQTPQAVEEAEDPDDSAELRLPLDHHSAVGLVFKIQLLLTVVIGLYRWGFKTTHLSYNIPDWLVLTAALSGLVGVGLLHVLKTQASNVSKGAQVIAAVVAGAVALIALLKGNFAVFVILGICIAGVVGWMRVVNDSIPFSCVMIEKAVDILENHAKLVQFTYGVVACLIAYVFTWGYVVAYAYHANTGNENFLIFLLLCLNYWTFAVAMNVITTSACAVTMAHFEGSEHVEDAVKKAFVESIGHNLGAIAYGSIVTPFLSTAFVLLRMLEFVPVEKLQEYVAQGLDMVDDWTKSYNNYAFVNIARQNVAYPTAAAGSWQLLKAANVLNVARDTLVEGLSFWNSLLFGTATGCAVGMWAGHFSIVFLGSFMAIGVIRTTLSLVAAVVMTTFIKYADSPEGFGEIDGQLKSKIRALIDVTRAEEC